MWRSVCAVVIAMKGWRFKIGLISFSVQIGATYYEDRYKQRVLTNLQRRGKSQGFILQEDAGDPVQEGVS